MGEFKDLLESARANQEAQQNGASAQNDVSNNEQSIIGRAIKNFPSSAGNLAFDTLKSLTIGLPNTVRSFDHLAQGLVNKLDPTTNKNEKYVDGLVEFYKNKYGSVKKAKESFANDPAGVMMDATALFSGFEGILGGLGKASELSNLSKTARVLKASGKIAGKLSKALDPLKLSFRPIGAALKQIPEGLPVGMWESSVKPSVRLSQEDRTLIAKTALENGITPTNKGVDKTRSLLFETNAQISNIIDNATASGKAIDINDLARHTAPLRARNSLSSQKAVNAIDNVVSDFMDAQQNAGRTTLTPSEAQRAKIDIYNAAYSAYADTKVPEFKKAKRAIARAIREDIEALHPEIKNLNKKDAALVKLEKEITNATNKISNKGITLTLSDIVTTPALSGIGAKLGGTTGATLGAAIGVGATIMKKPKVKLAIAQALYNAKTKPIRNFGTRARSAIRPAQDLNNANTSQ